MREYKVYLICKDYDNPNGINHRTQYTKEIDEETFRAIYDKLII